MSLIKKIKYDTNLFNFQNIIFEHFKKKSFDIKKDISNIHEKINFYKNILHDVKNLNTPIYDLKKDYFDVKLDQKNKFVTYFYKIDKIFDHDKMMLSNGKFYNIYLDLLRHLQKTFFKEEIIVQSKPTLRVHIPDNISVGSYHKDSDYGHPEEEINIWVPFNKSMNTSALWLESEPGKKNFKPQNIDYGEILIFNSKLTHGTEINKENHSRLSMDFRVIKKKNFKNNSTLSPKNNIKFNLGGYFREL
jgi:hypothetical protein